MHHLESAKMAVARHRLSFIVLKAGPRRCKHLINIKSLSQKPAMKQNLYSLCSQPAGNSWHLGSISIHPSFVQKQPRV